MARGRSLLVVSAVLTGLVGGGAPAASAATHEISVSATAFTPAAKTVEKGDTVRWTFTTAGEGIVWDAPATFAASHPGCSATALAKCSVAGDQRSVIFPATGTFTYRSAVDSTRTGTVSVQDKTAPAPVTSFTGSVADARVYLRWAATKPADFARFEVRRFAASATPSRTTGTLVHVGAGFTKTVTGLRNGTAYKFAVWVVDTAGNASAPRSLIRTPWLAPTTLSMTRSKLSVGYGSSLTLTGTLRATNVSGTVYRKSGERVELRRRYFGTTAWATIGARTTDSNGNVSFTFKPTRGAHYGLVHLRTLHFGASASPRSPVSVAVAMSATVTSTFVGTGAPIAATGRVLPAHSGRRIYLQRKTSTGWSNVASSTLGTTGTYSISYAPPSSGGHYLRVYFPSDVDHTGGVRALPKVTATSRTLRSGMTGADVLALQQELVRQKYDVGAVDGRFGYDTLHAVVPFQKVNRMARDGIVGPLVRARMGKPVRARMREVRGAGHVEVDLTKQVIVLGHRGKVVRIVDTSSGNGQLYTVDGQTSRATTPTGRFAFTRKINGLRISRLGELWRPAYFYGGYAIHGSPSVPSQPASHGCLRVTNASQDRNYHRWEIGMPIWIFRT
ncbi:MAG TPA: peptidoglycan-binding protein [Mycobacteriales bacterium]|nr:peptidoglycan-binding protein [Mycobacteriales bacterium]